MSSSTHSSGDGGSGSGSGGALVMHVGHDELVIRQRYEVLSIINDILIGVWFIIGSFFFFSDALTFAGTWFFVAGSIELLIRPIIRLTRRVHLQRYRPESSGAADASRDF
jgi:hypothetical protein